MQLTTETRARLEEIAQRHGFSTDAAGTMLSSLVAGQGCQAQFDHPEFGGMGQWSGGGMLMIGAMFDTGLKSRVDRLIGDLAGLAGSVAQEDRPAAAQGGGAAWPSGWPADLGAPSSSGSQNGMDYAVFPDTRRLAVRQGGQVSVYDTGDHRIGGVSQQHGGGHGLRFSSQHGPVSLDSLTPVDLPGAAPSRAAEPEPAEKAAPQPESSIPAMIDQLHGLLSRGILTQAEFDAKKADLLNRL